MKYLSFLFFCVFQCVLGQTPSSFIVHSHNDYVQDVPYWKAFSSGATSIEADVFLKDGALYVTHHENEIEEGKQLENAYLHPLEVSLAAPYTFPEQLQLLIDVKSDAYTTLDALIEILKKYPKITNNKKVKIVISGNRPKVEEYTNYPDFIYFDYQQLTPITDTATLDKIAMVSLSFGSVSAWNGLGRLTAPDAEKVTATIAKAHALHKPFRFWGTPDTKTAWSTFVRLGVDVINTDHPFYCVQYVSSLHKRTHENTVFSKVYTPTYASDGKDSKVDRVIFMIGDGNGLSQISAAVLANGGTSSLSQLKNIGFIKTQSADDFTTDSAAGATAMATGTKTNNRAIGVDAKGNRKQSLVELLADKKFATALVTTDEISGATPSSFYAHRVDRSEKEGILEDLTNSKLYLAIARGGDATDANFGFTRVNARNELERTKADKLLYLVNEEDYKKDVEKNELSLWTKTALNILKEKAKKSFIMIEGANIDSNGHTNNVKGIIEEGIGFDKAIGVALAFADKNPNTLVIITADHETSGFSLPHGANGGASIEGDFNSHDHSATMVPIFAYGPQSDTFQGIYENNEVFYKILKALEVTAK